MSQAGKLVHYKVQYRLLPILGVALAYWATGWLGWQLALPPGYVPAIWPAAGLALAAVLRFGAPVWPGVALGAFAIQAFGIGGNGSSWIVAVGVALGAAAQAVVGSILVRRFGKFPNGLTDEWEIISFAVLGGAAAGVVNAMLGPILMAIAGQSVPADLPANVVSWWLGDVFGVAIFAPLIMMWADWPKGAAFRERRVGFTLVMAGLFLLTVLAVMSSLAQERAKVEAQFNGMAAELSSNLGRELAIRGTLIQSVQQHVSSQPELSQPIFAQFAQWAETQVTGLRSLGWVVQVSAADLARWERETQSLPAGPYVIREQGADGAMRPAGSRNTYFPLTFLEPMVGREWFMGMDETFEPARHAAIDLALRSGQMVATAPIILMSAPDGQKSMLVFVPVYTHPLMHHKGSAARKGDLRGLVFGVIRAQDIIPLVTQNLNVSGVDIQLLDETMRGRAETLFTSQENQAWPPPTSVGHGFFQDRHPLHWEGPVHFASRDLRLVVHAMPSYYGQHQSRLAWGIWAVGLVFTFLSGVVFLSVRGRSVVLRRKVAERVNELHEKEQQLLASDARFRLLLSTAADGVHILDGKGRLIECNDSFARMLGYARDDMVGLTVSDWDDAFPTADVLEMEVQRLIQQPEIFVTRHRRKDGSFLDVEITCRCIVLDGESCLYASARDVTERLRTEASLLASEDRLRMLVETTTDWVWETDAEHRFTWFSDTFEAVLGIASEKLMGQRRWDVASHRREIDPMLWQKYIEDLHHNRSFRNFRYWLDGGDGQPRWISVSGSPRFDESGEFIGYRGVGEDVTEEAATAVRMKMLSTVVEQSPVSVIVSSPRSKIEYVNANLLKSSGYSEEEVLGKSCRLFASGETPREVYDQMWTVLNEGQQWSGELLNRRKDGTLYWDAMVISPVMDTLGEVVHYVAIREDITEMREMREKITRANAELEQFAYVASHDLRQPLRMVTSYLGLIDKRLGESFDADLRKYFDYALNGAKRMDAMILDLLDYSRTGQNAQYADVSLAIAVRHALTNLSATFAEIGPEIIVADGLPTIKGNLSELIRVFQNLLDNAVKYRVPGQRPQVQIGWNRQGKMHCFWVKDNGIGIDSESHDRAFMVFQRLVPKSAYDGTGIGLAVTKKIIEQHGGHIWIESKLEHGSTFFFTLPVIAERLI